MRHIEPGVLVINEPGNRTYHLSFTCPSDGKVTPYFDCPVHATSLGSEATLVVHDGDGAKVFEQYDALFTNCPLRWNPTFDVAAGQLLFFKIRAWFSIAEASIWTCQLTFDDGKPDETGS